MNRSHGLMRSWLGAELVPPAAANDPDPFDGTGPGDWGDHWIDERLRRIYQADAEAAPTPRLAELLRRLEASMTSER